MKIKEGGGGEILEFYEKYGMLSNKLRMKLVNAVCSILIEKWGSKIPTHEKEKAAQAIINFFPNLKDPLAKKGYVCIIVSYIDQFLLHITMLLGSLLYKPEWR